MRPGKSYNIEILWRHTATRPLVLQFLTSTPESLLGHTADVAEILEHMDKEHIIPPLGIIQVLSKNGVASVGLVKEWLMTTIKQAREEISTVKQGLSLGVRSDLATAAYCRTSN